MPIVQVTSNLGRRLGSPLLKSLSALVGEITNKPAKGVIVMHNPGYEAWYDDSDGPLVHIRLTSLEMPVSDHVGYSSRIADLFNKDLQIKTERVIVEFYSPPPTHLGKNGSTIAEIRKTQTQ